MIIKIRKKTWIHYAVIYVLIIVNQSCLYEYFLDRSILRIGIFVFITAAMFLKYRHTFDKYYLTAAIFLITTAITRFVSGGIGIMAWIGWTIPILLCAYAVSYDIGHFLDRFVIIAVFLAAAGMVFFLLQITMPGILKNILMSEYNTKLSTRTWYDVYTYQESFRKGYGLFLYSFKDSGDTLMRNKGIFTEPGVCQMFYNSAVFILLFCPDKIKIRPNQIKRCLLVLIAAVITVQSTTGYVALGAMLISYLVMSQRGKKSYRSYLLMIVSVGGLFLITDLLIRGADSFLNVAMIQKIFGENDIFEIQLSGKVRIAATLLSVQTMFTHPFGVGADQFSVLMEADQMAGGGAGILKFGAMSGLIPFLIMVLFYVIPILKASERLPVKILLLLFIFSTLLAQTMPFYPVLIIFPVYFMETRKRTAVPLHINRSRLAHVK